MPMVDRVAAIKIGAIYVYYRGFLIFRPLS